MNEQDRRRKHALIVFQFTIYGFLLLMFLIQLRMLMTNDW
ncbi:hypothetical protein DFR71_3676 [Nocardia alba]|uniref:Uncharacterized protein n=1 Tax=Nocardia alba TaxID=225051 RepID=A0A4R1FUU5_9NOCA|nr:hypothetical protein DFR71_3676 [Nocardia alba]